MFQSLTVGVATANHPPPSLPVSCILPVKPTLCLSSLTTSTISASLSPYIQNPYSQPHNPSFSPPPNMPSPSSPPPPSAANSSSSTVLVNNSPKSSLAFKPGLYSSHSNMLTSKHFATVLEVCLGLCLLGKPMFDFFLFL